MNNMFNENGKMDDVFAYAESNGVGHHEAAAAIKSPHIAKPNLWPEPLDFSEAKKIESPNICVSDRGDILTELSKQIDSYLQFPVNTIFLHALGCVASAMTKAFKMDYSYTKLPINLYVITAQPPSTGKSEVNRRLFTPILKAYKHVNEKHNKERGKIEREISRLEKQLANPKKETNEFDEDELIDKIEQKQIRLKQIPEWTPAITNATIEAIDAGLDKNDGMFNIVSAEAEAINVAVGGVYGDKDKKSNMELILGAWDGEWYASDRVSRNGYTGHVRASISVLAQDDTIDTLLQAGASGRGLTERFLLLSEKPKLGKRDHYKKYSFNESLYRQYENLIQNIIEEDSVVLNFSVNANDAIRDYKAKLEPTMADGGKHSHNLVTGFIGKADKQIRKIAAVLFVVDQWQDGADRERTITDDYIYWAIGIYDELAKTFINSADYMGYVGSNSEVIKLMETTSRLAQKGRLKIKIQELRQLVKNNRPFKGSRNMTQKIKEVLPQLELINYCLIDGNDIFINPRLR